MKAILPIVAAAALALPFAAPVPAAASNTKPAKTVAHHAATRSEWAAQDLTGSIAMVDPARKLVVIQTAGGVPFDLDVTRDTRIRNGSQRISLSDLSQDMNQNVSVRLIPERRGDVAAWIRLGS